ncbi:MAG: transposase [Burkholderiales bacterium]|nr:transposase [Burkholderiales bacterium]
MLDLGGGKNKKAYIWAFDQGAFKICPVWCTTSARAWGKYPNEFLKGWTGTLVVDAYAGYDATMSLEGRKTANCLAPREEEV